MGLNPDKNAREQAVQAGIVKPPSLFHDVLPSIEVPTNVTTLDLLDREHDR